MNLWFQQLFHIGIIKLQSDMNGKQSGAQVNYENSTSYHSITKVN